MTYENERKVIISPITIIGAKTYSTNIKTISITTEIYGNDNRIDSPILGVSSTCSCFSGFLYGEYRRLLLVLRLLDRKA